MASANGEIEQECHFFRVYKDGRVELTLPNVAKIPPIDDPVTGVRSKDVTISSDPPIPARLFLPKTAAARGCPKLPLLFYLHGGGFCMQSAFSREHHGFVVAVAAEADCVAVSVEYGLFQTGPSPPATRTHGLLSFGLRPGRTHGLPTTQISIGSSLPGTTPGPT